jgi:hypothetical protein
LLRKLGIAFVPYSPLGHGFLTGKIRSPDDLAADDWRKTNPRFTGEKLPAQPRHRQRGRSRCCRGRCNIDADRAGVGTRTRPRHRADSGHQAGRPRRGEHAADGIVLSAKQIERLNNLTPAAGKRHDEGNMAAIDP